jgi:hypothetical protein
MPGVLPIDPGVVPVGLTALGVGDVPGALEPAPGAVEFGAVVGVVPVGLFPFGLGEVPGALALAPGVRELGALFGIVPGALPPGAALAGVPLGAVCARAKGTGISRPKVTKEIVQALMCRFLSSKRLSELKPDRIIEAAIRPAQAVHAYESQAQQSLRRAAPTSQPTLNALSSLPRI